MSKFETNNQFEPTFKFIEKTSVNIARTSEFCKDSFNTPKNQEEVCKSLDNTFAIALAKEGINFKKILNTNKIV